MLIVNVLFKQFHFRPLAQNIFLFTSFTPPPITATPNRYNVDNIRILLQLLAECPQLKMKECIAQS